MTFQDPPARRTPDPTATAADFWGQAQPHWRQGQPLGTPVAAPDQPVPLWSAAARGYEDGWETRRRNARYERTDQELWNRHREVERRLGRRLPLSRSLAGVTPGASEESLLDRILFDPEEINAMILGRPGLLDDEAYEALLAEERRKNPALFEGIETREQLGQRIEADFTGTRQRADQAASSGWQGAVGSFVGQAGAIFSDPANIGVAVATGGWGAGRPLLTRMAIQAGVGGGQEALDGVDRARDAARFGGPDYTAAEFAFDVLAGGAGGAGFEALASGGAAAWRATARRFAGSETPVQRGIGAAMERLDLDERIIGDAPDFDVARDALSRGAPPPRIEPERDLDDLFGKSLSDTVRPMQPRSPGPRGDVSAGALIAAEYQGRVIWSGSFDPLRLEVDPVRFQYKAEGDAEGVTARLRGVERWDATASGKVIVFEDRSGRLVVADGHQRRGLARRLAEAGWEDARLDGHLFREADGWSPREVRVVAALKNMREGSGTILDAAKLFREAPQALRDRSLPVTGEFITRARQLASLSDEAFGAVVNGVIPERYAAIIGEQAAGRPEIHADLVAAMKKADPSTVEGARALVQEAMLDDFIASEGIQADLFGHLPREATLFARAAIREAVMRGLRRDAAIYGQLVKHADAIETGGNVLARTANEQALAIDRAASELVSRLSLRSGEIGEAFSDAARAVTVKEKTVAAVSKGLIQRIRKAVKDGEALAMARAEALDPPAPHPTAREAAEAFDAPGGPGQQGQLTVKPEDAEIEGAGAPAGLFDDLAELDPDEGWDRAIQHLTACAPGKG